MFFHLGILLTVNAKILITLHGSLLLHMIYIGDKVEYLRLLGQEFEKGIEESILDVTGKNGICIICALR